MKIHYIGTCSGTEPMSGMHHTSLAFELGDGLYWFDAGEGCAHSSYTSGIDVMKSRALIVSHPHIDHIGGLANLLALFAKLERRYGMRLPKNNTLEVVFPGLELFGDIKRIAFYGDRSEFDITERETQDGVVLEDENVKVFATHNAHLRENGDKGWHSFSFLIESEGKRVVFSGDVKELSELDGLLSGGCDLLICETGHHAVADVCQYAYERGAMALRFVHHGREIIEKREEKLAECAAFAERHGMSIRICSDGDVETL